MVTFLSRIRRRHIAVFLVVLLAGGAFSAYSLGVPLPGAGPSQPVSAENDQQRLKKVELAKGHSHVLTVPAEVRSSLGIRKNGHDLVAVAEPPKGKRPIVLSATTRFEPSSLYRTRGSFCPGRGGEDRHVFNSHWFRNAGSRVANRRLREGKHSPWRFL